MRSTRRRVIWLGRAAAGLVTVVSCAVKADDVAAWGKEREGRFETVRASHPPQDAEIARIKAATAVFVAAAPPMAPATDLAPTAWRTQEVPTVLFDDPVAPRMVVVPAGEFTMGLVPGESGRAVTEGPPHRVRIGYVLAVSMFPVTYDEYAWYAAATGRPATRCSAIMVRVKPQAALDWRSPGFPQMTQSPVTCISFDDAVAYAGWLARKTGKHYRLLSEAEYEFANRAGTATAFWWGDDAVAACKFVNGLDWDAQAVFPARSANSCRDGHAFTAPLDTSKANLFGLFDTTGNVASWTEDCWHGGTAWTAADGSPRIDSRCRSHAVRGGSWASPPAGLRAASRTGQAITVTFTENGFRVARALTRYRPRYLSFVASRYHQRRIAIARTHKTQVHI